MERITSKMNDQIMVSVYCLAYNHEKYIRSALEGFVKQKTHFKYEVFVHDDASTDNTAQIIKEFACKYPEIIKPIYQHENKYSKGILISREIIYPLMSGKYIAICEGDDYWCDENKLEKQVNFLEKNLEYSACVHNTKKINCITNEVTYINDLKENCDLKFYDVAKAGNAQFQLSSLLCRKEFFYFPDELIAKGFSDYPLSVYLMLKGKIYYYKDTMSVYRLYANGSWTLNNYRNVDINKRINNQKNILDFLDNLLNYCINTNVNSSYIEDINHIIRVEKVKLLLINNDRKEILKNYKDIYINLPLKEKLKVNLPFLWFIIRKVKNFFK